VVVLKKAFPTILLIFLAFTIISNKPLIARSKSFTAPLAHTNNGDYLSEFYYPPGYLKSIDNGTITVYLAQDDSGYIYLVSDPINATISKNRESNTRSGETLTSAVNSSIGIESTDVIASWVEAPAYWDRGSTITIKVGFRSYLPFTYTVSVTVTCKVYDRYWDISKGNYEKLEASGQKSATLVLRPRITKYVYVNVAISYTTVGLEKIVVSVTGRLIENYDGKYHGVCDEYAVLFISFARALNIPARQKYVHGEQVVSLFPYRTEEVSHEFAEIWDGERWVHADPEENVYDNPAYYRYNLYYIDEVYILAGANDSKTDADDSSSAPVPIEGVIYWWEFDIWESYPNNPYQ